MVFRTLARLLGSSDDLEDLAQDVFLRLFRALGHFRGDAELSTYLYRITVNVANDALSRRIRAQRTHVSLSDENEMWEERLPHSGCNAEQQLGDREIHSAVERGLTHLKPTERAVLVLYHQEELDYETIACTLGLPVNTVRTHLHRGRRKLRELVNAELTPPISIKEIAR